MPFWGASLVCHAVYHGWISPSIWKLLRRTSAWHSLGRSRQLFWHRILTCSNCDTLAQKLKQQNSHLAAVGVSCRGQIIWILLAPLSSVFSALDQGLWRPIPYLAKVHHVGLDPWSKGPSSLHLACDADPLRQLQHLREGREWKQELFKMKSQFDSSTFG